jgi:hypothetical protein
LISHIAVCGNQQFKTCDYGDGQKLAVIKFFPSARTGLSNGVLIDQIAGKSAGRPGVEQNEDLRTPRGRTDFHAVRSELENGVNLLARQSEFLHEFIDAHVLNVLEDGGNRCSRAFEYPCAAALAGNAFHSGALRPIDCRHLPNSPFIVAFLARSSAFARLEGSTSGRIILSA